MPRVIGVDPGTVSVDICGLVDGDLFLDLSLPTDQALADPGAFLKLLTRHGPPDLIAGPSGYGLPLIPGDRVGEEQVRLALLSDSGRGGGIGGLGRLVRLLAGSGLPVVFTPGVIHLDTIPEHRKLNRVDLGTADKVAAAALGVWHESTRRRVPAGATSFWLLELGGAFTAAIAVRDGAIVDGLGGSSGPPGWQGAGAWDGEVAFLAGEVTKEMLFRGGRMSRPGPVGLEGYVEGVHRAALSLAASHPAPEVILLSGRQAREAEVRVALVPRLGSIAPVVDLDGFAAVAKSGAQGAALIADGLAGGRQAGIVSALRLRESRGTALDHLTVISPAAARRRLGLPES
jgi:predicted butyrate kinase (DUF1464 family)